MEMVMKTSQKIYSRDKGPGTDWPWVWWAA